MLYAFLFAAFVATVLTPVGITGAFLILPFMVSVLGFTAPAVSATNIVYNVVAIPMALYRYFKERRLFWQLGLIIAASSLPGYYLGALMRVTVLLDPRAFKCFVGAVLLALVFLIVMRIVREWLWVRTQRKKGEPLVLRNVKVMFPHMTYELAGRQYTLNWLYASLIFLGIGVIGGAYGIGGGAFTSPILVGVFGQPVHAIAGATLMGTFAASAWGIVVYTYLQTLYPSVEVAPNWPLGLLIGAGGLIGMYVGPKLQGKMPEGLLRLILVCAITPLALQYIVQYFIR